MAEDSEAEMEASTDDCDAEMDDSTDETEAEAEEAPDVTGTGTTIVPVDPVEVLRVKPDAVAVVTGTGTTVITEALEAELEEET